MPNRSARAWILVAALAVRAAAALLVRAAAVATAAVAAAATTGLPDDIGTGTLMLRTDAEAGFDTVAAPLSTSVRISVAGIVARVAVAQRFRNAGTDWVEAVYAFPLPDDAAVDRLVMRVGERVIEGEIREREEAKRVYETARDAGQHASLVTQARPNLFTASVANIAPGETIDIAIEYLQTAHYDDGALSLRFPMTFTPRYDPGGTRAPELFGVVTRASNAVGERLGALATDATATPVPPVTSTRVLNEASISVTLDAGLPLAEVASPYHEIRVHRDGDGTGTRYTLETLTPTVPMDRDFVVTWRPEVGATPAAAALAETFRDATYVLLTLLPPRDVHAYRSEPRELVLVIDTSGSMGGEPLEQAKRAVADALGRLTGADRFNLVQFNSKTSSLYAQPVPFTPETYAEALRYVKALDANGGTHMRPALTAALARPAVSPRPAGYPRPAVSPQPTAPVPGYLRQVVFLTDGGVANETELFGVIEQNLGEARLFTVGIGAAPNAYFMRKAAEFGRGTYTHIANAAEAAKTMGALFEKLEHAALTDVVADWPGAVEVYPQRVPDLYAGEPVVIAARIEAPLDRTLSLEVFGRAAGVPWSRPVAIGAGASDGIAKLWARRKIEYLADGRVRGASPDLVRQLATGVALEYSLVSEYTSLVAVDKTPARSRAAAAKRRTLANMSPAGAVYAQFPQTATAAPLLRALGVLLLAAAAVVGLRRTAFAR